MRDQVKEIAREVGLNVSEFRVIVNKVQKGAYNGFRNGYIFLKGGDLHEELSEVRNKFKTHDISSVFEEEFFETKKVLYTEVL